MFTDQVQEKINEIILELKQQQLWNKQVPGWVTDFSRKEVMNETDFAAWLQFVLLPNLRQKNNSIRVAYLAPQAVKFFREDVKKGKLLQLLVELDSLT